MTTERPRPEDLLPRWEIEALTIHGYRIVDAERVCEECSKRAGEKRDLYEGEVLCEQCFERMRAADARSMRIE